MTEQNQGNTFLVNKLSKKSSKKNNQSQIPLEALGFRAKIFYQSNYEYVPRKKYNKHNKYENEKKQKNFRSKLTCVVDPSHATHQQIGDMNFNKRSEWSKIKYVIFKSKQELYCCICLNKKFVAPQMTFCGHVFCWHCILMHYEKSLKATSCPVCNQIFQIQQLKTCITLYLPPLNPGDKIRLSLKFRQNELRTIFNPQTLQEQPNLSHVIRMKNRKVLQKYQQQHDNILSQMKSADEPETQKYLMKVLEKSQTRIQNLKRQIQQQTKSSRFKPHKHEMIKDDIVCHVLTADDIDKEMIMTFYQEQSGRYVYLHPICEKYLVKNFQSQYLPLIIEETVLMKQQTEFSQSNIKKYKYLNHLSENQNFQFVFIKMNNLIEYRLMQQFEKQFQLYKKKKQQIQQKQQEYSKLLNQKYEKDQEYLRELKKMQMSQFHDIVVPTNMIDLKLIQDQNIFPSLVQNSSVSSQTQSNNDSEKGKSQTSQLVFGKKNKKNGKKFVLKEQDFPGLNLAIKISLQQTQNDQDEIEINRTISQKQSQISKITQDDFPSFDTRKISAPVESINYIKSKKDEQKQDDSPGYKVKGKKKKKQRFIDVTHQFFQKKEDDQY